MSKFSIKKNVEFRKVYNEGKNLKSGLLIMYYKNTGESNVNRVGICVSKKVGNSVVRSRIKRLINENYRLIYSDLKNGYDVVFIARSGSDKASFKDIKTTITYLLDKSSILKK